MQRDIKQKPEIPLYGQTFGCNVQMNALKLQKAVLENLYQEKRNVEQYYKNIDYNNADVRYFYDVVAAALGNSRLANESELQKRKIISKDIAIRIEWDKAFWERLKTFYAHELRIPYFSPKACCNAPHMSQNNTYRKTGFFNQIGVQNKIRSAANSHYGESG